MSLKQRLREAEAAATRPRGGPAGGSTFPPPPRFNAKALGPATGASGFGSTRGGNPGGWEGPPGGRPRHEGPFSGERKRPYDKDSRDERSHSNKRSSR